MNSSHIVSQAQLLVLNHILHNQKTKEQLDHDLSNRYDILVNNILDKLLKAKLAEVKDNIYYVTPAGKKEIYQKEYINIKNIRPLVEHINDAVIINFIVHSDREQECNIHDLSRGLKIPTHEIADAIFRLEKTNFFKLNRNKMHVDTCKLLESIDFRDNDFFEYEAMPSIYWTARL